MAIFFFEASVSSCGWSDPTVHYGVASNPERTASLVNVLRGLKLDRRVKILEKYNVFWKYDAAPLRGCVYSAQATEFALGLSSRPVR